MLQSVHSIKIMSIIYTYTLSLSFMLYVYSYKPVICYMSMLTLRLTLLLINPSMWSVRAQCNTP